MSGPVCTAVLDHLDRLAAARRALSVLLCPDAHLTEEDRSDLATLLDLLAEIDEGHRQALREGLIAQRRGATVGGLFVAS